MATAIYVPCLAIEAVTGGRIDLRVMIAVLGVIVTGYTMLGGIQAVIWNDVMQFCIMFGGLGATVWLSLSHVPGGLTEIWAAAQHAGAAASVPAIPVAAGVAGRIQLFFMQPINLWALVVTMVLGRMASYTAIR